MKTPSMTHDAQNSALNVISRLSGEIAYTRKRLCVRRCSDKVNAYLEQAAEAVEQAILLQDAEERKECR